MATHNIVVFGGDHCGPEVCAPIPAAIGVVRGRPSVVRGTEKENGLTGFPDRLWLRPSRCVEQDCSPPTTSMRDPRDTGNQPREASDGHSVGGGARDRRGLGAYKGIDCRSSGRSRLTSPRLASSTSRSIFWVV
jgi:hypothetical protein